MLPVLFLYSTVFLFFLILLFFLFCAVFTRISTFSLLSCIKVKSKNLNYRTNDEGGSISALTVQISMLFLGLYLVVCVHLMGK